MQEVKAIYDGKTIVVTAPSDEEVFMTGFLGPLGLAPDIRDFKLYIDGNLIDQAEAPMFSQKTLLRANVLDFAGNTHSVEVCDKGLLGIKPRIYIDGKDMTGRTLEGGKEKGKSGCLLTIFALLSSTLLLTLLLTTLLT